MNRELRVLMLEDTPTDAELAEHELRKAGIAFTSLRVETRDAFVRALEEFRPDIVLSDYKLPDFNGIAALEIVQRDHPEIPVVMVTGALPDIEAVELIHAGARDYVLKDRLARLAPAVQRALSAEQGVRARKSVENALKQSEADMRTLVEHSPIAMLVDVGVDADEKIVMMNQKFTGLFGYTLEDVPDVCHWWPLAYPDEKYREEIKAEWTGRVEKVIQSHGDIEPMETTVTCKDGSIRYVRISLASIGSRNIIAFEDLTERKQMEKNLLRSEVKFRTVYESSSDAIMLLDEKCFFDCNEATLRVFGCPTRDDFINKHPSQLSPPTQPGGEDSVRLANEHIAMAFKNGSSQFEWMHCRLDGSEFPAEVLLTRIEVGSELFLQSTVRDITERKQVEKALELNSQRVQALLQLNQMTGATLKEITAFTLQAAVRLTQSKIGYMAFLNEDETILTMHSWSKSAMAECAIIEKPIIYPVETTGLWGEAVRQRRPVITNDYTAANPLKKGYPEGLVHINRHMNVPVFDGGLIVIVAGVGNKDEEYDQSDVQQLTLLMEGMWRLLERKRAEEELRRYKDHLEEEVQQRTADLVLARNVAEAANRAKSVFLSSMSHEFRTPLNAILGFSSMVRKDPLLPRELRDNLDIINRSGENLLTLINDVLEMAKIEAGCVQVASISFDLGALVRDVTDMMQLRAHEKGLQLLIDQSSEFPRYIKGDEARLRQVLINLAGNAVKFTEQGGVTVRFGMRPHTPQQRLLIEVEDSGIGISEADQQKIFEPFVQLEQSATQQGTGLGLTITRQFVHLMGGTISVESTQGVGSTFRVELPAEKVAASDVAKHDNVIRGEIVGLAAGQPEYRILIVEDQLENQLLLARLMQNVGLQVMVAQNGQLGVELFQNWQPHLIWMDRRMPVMDGLAATRRIRELPGGSDVKIVAVTASAFTEQRVEMLNAGMDDFVRKPYRFNEIYECLTKHLGVKYTYSDANVAEEVSDATLTPEMLAVLPQDLRRELHDALESLESERIAAVIGQVATHDLTLHKTLSHLAVNFEYPAILKALQTTLPVNVT